MDSLRKCLVALSETKVDELFRVVARVLRVIIRGDSGGWDLAVCAISCRSVSSRSMRRRRAGADD